MTHHSLINPFLETHTPLLILSMFLTSYYQRTEIIKYSPAPCIIDDFVNGLQQFFCGNFKGVDRDCHSTGHHVINVVRLVPKQWHHHHGNAVADALRDAMGASMSEEEFSLGMSCVDQNRRGQKKAGRLQCYEAPFKDSFRGSFNWFILTKQ